MPNADLSASAWCLVGGGNMAHAIVLGALDAGVAEPGSFTVVELDAQKRREFESRGVVTSEHIAEGLQRLGQNENGPDSGHILLAVKPQGFAAVAKELKPLLAAPSRSRRVVSIMAGTNTMLIEHSLGPGARVIRVMPNTPARVRAGIAAWALGASGLPGDERETVALFDALGGTIRIDESLFDAFTALAGSGPAYLFYIAEALVRAGIEHGFSPGQADEIVRAMLKGAAQLLTHDPSISPEALRLSVTSKGGTTAAATRVLDDANVQDLFVRAIAAGTARGRELSKQ